MAHYIFQSERIGFRTWTSKDLKSLTAINSDPEVMKYFPTTYGENQTKDFINRMNDLHDRKGYCYFAADHLESGELMGFIGLSDINYDAPFTPAVDIGWRLSTHYWNKGLATEGAKRCLEYSAEKNLKEIVAVAPKVNLPSINVMQKIGMKFSLEFDHPQLKYSVLNPCVCYRKGE